MIYYFTEEQWDDLWSDGLFFTLTEEDIFKKYKLVYSEQQKVGPGFWGQIEGTENDITMFLLRL